MESPKMLSAKLTESLETIRSLRRPLAMMPTEELVKAIRACRCIERKVRKALLEKSDSEIGQRNQGAANG